MLMMLMMFLILFFLFGYDGMWMLAGEMKRNESNEKKKQEHQLAKCTPGGIHPVRGTPYQVNGGGLMYYYLNTLHKV